MLKNPSSTAYVIIEVVPVSVNPYFRECLLCLGHEKMDLPLDVD